MYICIYVYMYMYIYIYIYRISSKYLISSNMFPSLMDIDDNVSYIP